MKDKIVLLLLGIFVICFSSCLGNDDDNTDYTPSGDAQVYYFHLQNDSIPALDSVKFTIDQLNGKIYNPDSMAYGTVIKEKALCTFTTRGVAGIQVKQTALADTLSWWNTTDSLDFTKPVEFVVTPMDGIHKKPYTAWINIHTVNPDSMQWNLVSSDLYGVEEGNLQYQGLVPVKDGVETKYVMFMADASAQTQTAFVCYPDLNRCEAVGNVTFTPDYGNVDWEQLVSFNGNLVVGTYDNFQGIAYQSAPPAYTAWTGVTSATYIHSILGVVNKTDKQKSYLAAIGKKEGKYVFMRTSDLENWETGAEVDQDNFPMGGGFARLSYENMYHPYLLLAGGRNLGGTKFLNTIWNTTDGLNWVKYESSQPPFTEGMAGASLVEYDGLFYLLGGMNSAGQATKNIVCSADRGLSWQPAGELLSFPEEYAPRAYSAAFVTPENYLFVFSGKTSISSPYTGEVWKGRINRLGFAGMD